MCESKIAWISWLQFNLTCTVGEDKCSGRDVQYDTVRDKVKGLHRLCVRANNSTFIIFYFPSFAITILLFPINILRNSEERLFLFTLDTLHNRCDKLF